MSDIIISSNNDDGSNGRPSSDSSSRSSSHSRDSLEHRSNADDNSAGLREPSHEFQQMLKTLFEFAGKKPERVAELLKAVMEPSFFSRIKPSDFQRRNRYLFDQTRLDWRKHGLEAQLKNMTTRCKDIEKKFTKLVKRGDPVLPLSQQWGYLRELKKLEGIVQKIGKIQQKAKEADADWTKNKLVIAVFQVAIDKIFHRKADKINNLIEKDMRTAIEEGEKQANKMRKETGNYESNCISFQPGDEGSYKLNRWTLGDENYAIKLKGIVERDTRYIHHNYIVKYNPTECFQKAQDSRAWLNKKIREIKCNAEKYVPLLKTSLEDYRRRTTEKPQCEENPLPSFLIPATDGSKGLSIPDEFTDNSSDRYLKEFSERYPDQSDEGIAQALRAECDRVAEEYDQTFQEFEQVNLRDKRAIFYYQYTQLIGAENMLTWLLQGNHVEETFNVESEIIKYERSVFQAWYKHGNDVSDIVSKKDIEGFLCKDLFYARQAAMRDKKKLQDYKQICTKYKNLTEELAVREEIINEYKEIRTMWDSVKKDPKASLAYVLQRLGDAIELAETMLPKFTTNSWAGKTRKQEIQQWKNDREQLTEIKKRIEDIPTELKKQVKIWEAKAQKAYPIIQQLQPFIFHSEMNITGLGNRPNPEEAYRNYLDLKRATTAFVNHIDQVEEELNSKEIISSYQSFKNEVNRVIASYYTKRSCYLNTVGHMRDQLLNWSQTLGTSARGDNNSKTAFQKWHEALRIAETILPEYSQDNETKNWEETFFNNLKEDYTKFLEMHPEVVTSYEQDQNSEELYDKFNELYFINENIQELIKDWFFDDVWDIQKTNDYFNEFWNTYKATVEAILQSEDYLRNHPQVFEQQRKKLNDEQNQAAKRDIERGKQKILISKNSLELTAMRESVVDIANYGFRTADKYTPPVEGDEYPPLTKKKFDFLIKDKEGIKNFYLEISKEVQKIKDLSVWKLMKEIKDKKDKKEQ